MSVYREADSSAPLAITPAIDFAIVLSRTLADLNKDPAQLRNVVYQLARIKLEQEVAQRNSRVDPVEMKQLSLALESAIDRVETIYSKCDNPRLLSCSQSSPAADRPRIAIEPPKASARDSYFRALRLSADCSCGPRQQSAAGYPTGVASAVNRCAILTICGICAAHRLW